MKSEKTFMNNFTKNIIIALDSIIIVLSALIAIELIRVLSIIIISIILLVLIGNELKKNSERRKPYGTTRIFMYATKA